MKHDHHCPWIGACVGEMNHFMFVMCLLAHTCQAVTTLYVVCFIVYYQRYSNRCIFISTTTNRRIPSALNMACTCCGRYSWSCTFCLPVDSLCSIFILYWRMWLPASWPVEKSVRISKISKVTPMIKGLFKILNVLFLQYKMGGNDFSHK